MSFVSVASLPSPPLLRNPTAFRRSPPPICFQFHAPPRPTPHVGSLLETASGGRDAYGHDLGAEAAAAAGAGAAKAPLLEDDEAKEGISHRQSEREGSELELELGWEDQILEDTVPLVVFVRTILHSSKYESGDRLAPEHVKIILERLLPYHPAYGEKIGCGVDYITVGYHPDYECTKCLFIVRKDGELVDFSYWKCVKGLIRKKYPLYAASFIHRHFRRRRRRK